MKMLDRKSSFAGKTEISLKKIIGDEMFTVEKQMLLNYYQREKNYVGMISRMSHRTVRLQLTTSSLEGARTLLLNKSNKGLALPLTRSRKLKNIVKTGKLS